MSQQRKTNPYKKTQKNPLEALLEPVFGQYSDGGVEEYPAGQAEKLAERPQRRKETVFNFREHYEKENVQKQVQELMQQIKREIEEVKKVDASLLQEVRDIEKMSVEDLPAKAGIYHVRFLEILLSMLRTVRSKMGESKTWLEAMMSKKKKRGSLFAVRSKKMGTQYSLSQELQSARSVQ